MPTASGNFRITSRSTGSFWALTAGRDGASSVNNYMYTGATDQQWVFERYTLSLSSSQMEVVSGNSAWIYPNTDALGLTWTSSDSSIVLVAGSNDRAHFLARSLGTATITAKAVNGSTATCTVRVIDHRTQVLMSLTRNELYYLYSPKTKLVQADLPIKTRLDFIEIFRKYDDSNDIEALNEELKSSLNADFPLWFTENLWSEYLLGVKGLFTPEMQYALTQQYLETIKQFVVIVGFSSAANLLPFDASGNIKYNATEADIQADFAHALTNNPSSNKVMLGSQYGETKYNVVASQQNMTYFYSAYYNQLEAKYGTEYMRAINRQFLSQQTALGKEIWFSHDPTTAYSGTGFEMEVNWLKQHYGISEFNANNLQKVGDLWKLTP